MSNLTPHDDDIELTIITTVFTIRLTLLNRRAKKEVSKRRQNNSQLFLIVT